MIEYENCGKLESLAELENAIEMGLDIEFLLYDTRYNISWRDNKPFICECPEGVAKFLIPQNFCYRGMKWVAIL